MIKLTNAYLVGIIAATLLVGCGSGSSDGSADDGGSATSSTPTTETPQPVEPNNGTGGGTPATPPPTTTPSTPAPTTPAAKKFGANVMPILVAQCQSCHGSNGRFTITSASSTYNNISALKSPMTAAGKYLLDKATNKIGHGGGVRFSSSSSSYVTIKSWVDAGAKNN